MKASDWGGSNGSSIVKPISINTDNYTLTDWSSVCLVDSSLVTGALSITIPLSTENSKGKSITIKKISNDTNPICIKPNGTDIIDDSTNWVYLYGKGNIITITSSALGQSVTLDNKNNIGIIGNFLRVTKGGQSTNINSGDPLIFDTVETRIGNDIIYNPTTSAFTLPPNRTFKLTMEIPKVNMSNGGYCYTRWYNDTTLAYVGSGSGGDAVTSTSSTMSGCLTTLTITPTVTTTLRCRISGISNVTSLGDSGNINWAEVEELRKQIPVMETTQYLQVSRINSELLVNASNKDLIFNNIVGGNIPYNTTTGVATLTGGLTYNLIGEPLFGAFADVATGYIVYEWVDATTNVGLIPNKQGAGEQISINRDTNESFIPTARVNGYTPSTNQNVKLRATLMASGSTLRHDMGSKAVIQQVGSVGVTSIPNTLVDSFTGATSSGNGTKGGVPIPLLGQQNSLLKGDGTWDNMDWKVYTPTLTSTNTSFHLANTYTIKELYKVIGKTLHLKFIYNHGSNTGCVEGSGSQPYTISIPSGYTIDTTKANLPSILTSVSGNGAGSDCIPLGHGFYCSGTATSFPIKIVPLSATTLGIHLPNTETRSAYTLWGCGQSYYGVNNAELTFEVAIPIL